MKQSEPLTAGNFTKVVMGLIKRIPRGKVCTYGLIASAAGNTRAARQVAWILHAASQKEGLPWHRVVNRSGKISLPPHKGYDLQKELLKEEGVVFDLNDKIPFDLFLWLPGE